MAWNNAAAEVVKPTSVENGTILLLQRCDRSAPLLATAPHRSCMQHVAVHRCSTGLAGQEAVVEQEWETKRDGDEGAVLAAVR